MPEECRGIGNALVQLFPLTELSDESKAKLTALGNKAGSVCLATQGRMRACPDDQPRPPREQPEEVRACCNIESVSVDLRGVRKFRYRLKLTFVVEGVPVSGELKFDLDFSAEERGRVLREFCKPPDMCEDERVQSELYLRVQGSYEVVLAIEALGLDVGTVVKVDAALHMGQVTVSCSL